MGCGCGKHGPVSSDVPAVTRPDSPCVFCAEKHFATAFALAGENAYEAVNRLRLIGELVLAQWHLWERQPKTARAIRDIRHAVEHHLPVGSDAWEAVALDLDALTAAAADSETTQAKE